MSNLYRVLYCSRSDLGGSAEANIAAIRQILDVSRRNNARDGITGGLLFSDQCFAQVLEGPADAVERAFERIQCDARHSDVTILEASAIEARNFPDWSMAFAGLESASPIGNAVMSAAFSGQTSAGDEVLNLLKHVVVREDDWLTSEAA